MERVSLAGYVFDTLIKQKGSPEESEEVRYENAAEQRKEENKILLQYFEQNL